MTDKRRPKSRIKFTCDGSVSCAPPTQNKNQSAGAARITEQPKGRLVKGKRGEGR